MSLLGFKVGNSLPLPILLVHSQSLGSGQYHIEVVRERFLLQCTSTGHAAPFGYLCARVEENVKNKVSNKVVCSILISCPSLPCGNPQ